MKYIKITLLLAIAASSTLHGFKSGDAASAGTSNGTPSLPPCMAIEQGSQYHRLMQAGQSVQETFAANHFLRRDFNSGCTTSAELSAGQEAEQPQELAANKKFVCLYPQCGYGTNNKSNLITHKRKHTGERPYKCDHPQCDKAFKQLQHLITHKRKHTGERPYKCDHPQCDKAFMSGSDLNRHNRAVHGDIGNSSRECSMRLPSCEQTPADSQCHNFTQLTEESQDTALLLYLARNPRNFAAPESANKRREVSEDRPPFTIPVITIYQNPVKPAQEWVHINRQSYSCPVPNCLYKTHNKENLRSHMRAKHPAPACPH